MNNSTQGTYVTSDLVYISLAIATFACFMQFMQFILALLERRAFNREEKYGPSTFVKVTAPLSHCGLGSARRRQASAAS